MSQTQEVIDSIKGIATESATVAIEQYSAWYFTNAVTWLVFGVMLVVVASIFIKRANTYWAQERILGIQGGDAFPMVVLLMVMLLGVIFIFSNVANLFGSEAYAIHQLLNDLRGE